jgi:hypothetical protein
MIGIRLWRARILPGVGLLLLSPLLAACSPTNPMREPDSGYPSSWPPIAHLGTDCLSLSGTYANAGAFVTRDGGDGRVETPVRLTKLLMDNDHPEAATVGLTLSTWSPARDGSSFASLSVAIDGGGSASGCGFQAYCINSDLALPDVRSRKKGLPFIAAGAEQTNLWLSKAEDGSLIVHTHSYAMGMVVIVPFYSQNDGWARFPPVRP